MPTRQHGQATELIATVSAPDGAARVTFTDHISSVRRSRAPARDHLLPGFIDLQVNGAYGIDVMSASSADLLQLSHLLAHEGTTAWLPTVITAPPATIERCDAVIAEAMAAQSAALQGGGRPAGAEILGMHLEGPFISPARRGAHPPLTLLPVGAPLERVLALKTLRMVTMAPELEGAFDAIARLVARRVVVSLGHTDATYEEAVAGLQAGATMFTHLFNAMPPLHHRTPGVIGAATGVPRDVRSARPFVGVIPDGAHLHPATVRLLFGLPLVFTTDRVSLAGEGVAERMFGQPSASIREQDGAARLSDGSLAGSVITMHDAARWLIEELGGDWTQVAEVCSLNPARLLGLLDRGAVEPGRRADLLLADERFSLKAVYLHGHEID